jgi:hypothetical protein
LLTLGESADRYSPFLESDWHFKSVPGEVVIDIYGAGRKVRAVMRPQCPPEERHVREACAKHQIIGNGI